MGKLSLREFQCRRKVTPYDGKGGLAVKGFAECVIKPDDGCATPFLSIPGKLRSICQSDVCHVRIGHLFLERSNNFVKNTICVGMLSLCLKMNGLEQRLSVLDAVAILKRGLALLREINVKRDFEPWLLLPC